MMDPGQKVLSDGYIFLNTQARSPRHLVTTQLQPVRKRSESGSEIRATKRKREAHQASGSRNVTQGYHYATLRFLISLRLRYVRICTG